MNNNNLSVGRRDRAPYEALRSQAPELARGQHILLNNAKYDIYYDAIITKINKYNVVCRKIRTYNNQMNKYVYYNFDEQKFTNDTQTLRNQINDIITNDSLKLYASYRKNAEWLYDDIYDKNDIKINKHHVLNLLVE